MVSLLVQPIILTQFMDSFSPHLQLHSSDLMVGFTLIVSFWVRAIIDAIIFYGLGIFGLKDLSVSVMRCAESVRDKTSHHLNKHNWCLCRKLERAPPSLF